MGRYVSIATLTGSDFWELMTVCPGALHTLRGPLQRDRAVRASVHQFSPISACPQSVIFETHSLFISCCFTAMYNLRRPLTQSQLHCQIGKY